MSENSLLQEGDYAPDFTINIDGAKLLTLSKLRGENIVLYFYPSDHTPGCTQEGKDFGEYNSDFERANTLIIGVSKDSVESHDKFKSEHDFPFNLASDANSTVCEAYDCWVEKNIFGVKKMGISRDTYLIDNHGVIKKIWRKVKIDGHVEEVLAEAKKL